MAGLERFVYLGVGVAEVKPMWSKIFYALAIIFLVFSVRYNPEFTASAIRSGWFWVRAFADSLGRVLQSL